MFIAIGVKEKEMVEKFENLMTKLLAEGIIEAFDQVMYQYFISMNQKWLEDNYYDIKVYFGLEEATSKYQFYLGSGGGLYPLGFFKPF